MANSLHARYLKNETVYYISTYFVKLYIKQKNTIENNKTNA